MRIAQVHNLYQIAGGEDRVVELERALLVEHGHEVVPYLVTNDDIKGLRKKVAVFSRTPYSQPARKVFEQWLASQRPDVVHVHNFFPLLSPSIYDACAALGVPVVQTLHNFRTLCAGALLLRDGKFCDLCVGRLPLPGILHRCYRGSLAGSIAVAAMTMSYRRQRHRVHRFIALSRFAADVFARAGVPAERIAVKPNFVRDPGPPPAETPRVGALFVGRLSEEKGIAGLIDAWRDIEGRLSVAGTGPLEAELRERAPPSVVFHGWMQSDEIRAAMWRSAFLVAPSLSTEQFPMALAEAFSCGLPVVTSRSDALAEIVTDGQTGLLCAPGDIDELRGKVAWALAHPREMERMGQMARIRFEERYCAASNYGMLMRIYREAQQVEKSQAGAAPAEPKVEKTPGTAG